MLNNYKNFIFLIIIFLLVTLITYLFQSHIIEYSYERFVLANNPTVLFSCDKFRNENELNTIFMENRKEKVILLRKYLSENNGNLAIIPVGPRCPDKYQFVAEFGGEKQRIEVEKILGNQTIEGIPVYLRNI